MILGDESTIDTLSKQSKLDRASERRSPIGQPPNGRFPDSPVPVRTATAKSTGSRVRTLGDAGFALLVCAFFLLTSGCQSLSPTGMAIHSFTESEWFDRDQKASLLSIREDNATTISLSAGRREHAAFVFSINAPTEAVQLPDLTFTSLRGPGLGIPADAVSVYRIQPVDLENWPGWHMRTIPPAKREDRQFDVLVPYDAPRGGLPRTLDQGQTSYFWVDIRVPKNAFEGTYNGKVRVSAVNSAPAELAIQLTVEPYELRDELALPVLGAVDHRALLEHLVTDRGRPFRPLVDRWLNQPQEAQVNRVLEETFAILGDSRVLPVLHRLRPLVRVSADGTPTIQWDQYDQVISMLRQSQPSTAGKRWIQVPAPSHRDLNAVSSGRGHSRRILEGPHTHISWITRQLPSFLEHFANRGWLDEAYICWQSDPDYEVGAFVEFTNTLHYVRQTLADESIPNAPIVNPYFPHNPAEFGWRPFPSEDLRRDADIWMPSARYLDPTSLAEERAAGRPTWFRPAVPPLSGFTSILGRPGDTLCLAWQAARYHSEAMYLAAINDWPAPESGATPRDCVRHNPYNLLYPGTVFGLSVPIPSVRLFQLRRSIEDLMLFRLWTSDKQAIADSPDRRWLVRLAGDAGADTYRTHFQDSFPPSWPGRADVFELARRILRGRVTPNGSSGGTESARMRILEKRLVKETESVDLQFDGARLRLLDTGGIGTVRLSYSATLTNNTGDSIGGQLTLDGLPPGWTVGYRTPRRLLAPGQRMILNVTAEGASLPLGPNGLSQQVLRYEAGETTLAETQATVACVTAPMISSGIHVDGDLSDWSTVQGQRATDFSVLAPAASLIERRPTHPTTVTVARDEQSLYLAFRCSTDSFETRRDNRVTYSDLVPDAGDSVEILIDPLNAASRSPADVRHLLLKRSGGFLTEIGIGTDPPCGLRRSWPIDVDYAIREEPGFWIVEVSLPLHQVTDSDHYDDSDIQVWGINFCRFDAGDREYSTWSGALGTSYDPQSFGNVIIGRFSGRQAVDR